MKGVADSSPLHYLVQIKAEDVLRQIFVELITPPEVIAELTHPRAQVQCGLGRQILHPGFA